jgi:protein O-mannosyl-transferase
MTGPAQPDTTGTPDSSGSNAHSLPGCRINPAFQAMTRSRFLCLLLALVTLLVYLPVWQHAWLRFDDADYVTDNGMVQSGLTWSGMNWAFTTFHSSNWHPVTWLSHMLDVQLFGPGPAGPHGVNVLFHVANTVLLFILLGRMTEALWRSALVAALFALHPLHVESVAWVAERKDVLSAFFFLLTLLAYTSYVSKGNIQHSTFNIQHPTPGTAGLASRFTFHVSRFYLLSLFLFGLGLMSKPMLVTLPFVLLLLDYWPLQRFTLHASRFTLWPLVREKVPFILLSAVSCGVTFMAQQQGGAVRSLSSFSMSERMGNAAVACAGYLGKMFWPADLAVFYPHPGHWPVGPVVLGAMLVAGLCLAVLWFGRRFPFAITGWFWFLGMLVPAIGLVQVSNQSMADRYTYLPSIGVFIMIAWGAGAVCDRWRWAKAVAGVAAGLVLVACAMQTRNQLHYWRDGESLFRHALAVTSKNFVAHNNLGNALLDKRQADEAITQYQKALEIQPRYADADNNLGSALLEKGRVDEAIACYQKALELQPDYALAHNNLGNALLRKGQVDEAIAQYQKALALQPDYANACNNLATAFRRKGQLDEALTYYRKALNIHPHHVLAHNNLGDVLLQQGRVDEATVHFQKAVELKPDDAEAQNNLGWCLMQTGRVEEGIGRFQKALEIQPGFAEAHSNLGFGLLQQGRVREAMAHLQTAVTLQPGNARTLSGLAWVLATCPDASVRDGARAMELAQRADRLTDAQDPLALRALAAAYAESGRFAQAVTTARQALPLAENQSNTMLADMLRSEMKRYQAGLPARETMKSETQNPTDRAEAERRRKSE